MTWCWCCCVERAACSLMHFTTLVCVVQPVVEPAGCMVPVYTGRVRSLLINFEQQIFSCKTKSAIYPGDSQHPCVTLHVNMARLEHELKNGVVPAADISNLLAIVRKAIKKTDMSIFEKANPSRQGCRVPQSELVTLQLLTCNCNVILMFPFH